MTDTNACTKCRETKPLTEFHRRYATKAPSVAGVTGVSRSEARLLGHAPQISPGGSDGAQMTDPVLTFSAARALTDSIKSTAQRLWNKVSTAYTGRAWQVLGYANWDAYCEAEFGYLRLRMPREERREVVCSLREAGLTIRAIASATGIDKNTVQTDLAHVCEIHTPVKPVERAKEVLRKNPLLSGFKVMLKADVCEGTVRKARKQLAEEANPTPEPEPTPEPPPPVLEDYQLDHQVGRDGLSARHVLWRRGAVRDPAQPGTAGHPNHAGGGRTSGKSSVQDAHVNLGAGEASEAPRQAVARRASASRFSSCGSDGAQLDPGTSTSPAPNCRATARPSPWMPSGPSTSPCWPTTSATATSAYRLDAGRPARTHRPPAQALCPDLRASCHLVA